MQAKAAPLAAVSRLFVAAKGRAVFVAHAVDGDGASAQAPGHALRGHWVGGVDVGGQTERCVVGQADGVCFVVKRQDAQHRAEDLLLRNRHVVAHIGKHRGLDVITALKAVGPTQAAGHQTGPFVDTQLDVTLHRLELAAHGQWTHAVAALARVHHAHLGCHACGDRHRLVVHGALHQQTRGCVARLPGVVEALAHRALNGLLQRRIGKHEVGRFAAQLLHHALDRVGRDLGHRHTGCGRAGERHQVHVRVGAQRRAHHGAVAIQQVEHARRVTGFVHHLGHQARRQGREFTGLHDHGATRQQSRGEFGHDLVDGPVPRRDEHAHADGLGQELAVCADRPLKRVVLGRVQGGLDVARAALGLGVVGQVPWRAHFVADGLGHLGVTFFEDRFELRQQGPAMRHRGLAEILKSAPRGLHRQRRVVGRAHGHRAHDALVGGVDDGVLGTGPLGFHPSAINIKVASDHVAPLACGGFRRG